MPPHLGADPLATRAVLVGQPVAVTDGAAPPSSRARRGVGAGPALRPLLLLLGLLPLMSGVVAARVPGFDHDRSIPALYATRQPYLCYHNAGLLGLTITNLGVVGSMTAPDYFGATWEGGEYLWGAALWIGAVAPNGLAYVSTGFAWTEEGEFELRPSLDPLDRIYAGFEGVTGGDRAGFTDSGGDDDGDGWVDEDPLNGRDDDRDGLIDEDYAAISQQMFACEFWDYTDEARAQHAKHEPLYVRVRQRSMAWSADGANQFIGLDYTIINDGFETLRDIYLGYFVDSDIGRKESASHHTDDGGFYAFLDTVYVDTGVSYACGEDPDNLRDCARRSLHSRFAYMYDTPGIAGGFSGDDLPSAANGYFATVLLGHTTDPLTGRAPSAVSLHTCRFFSGSGTYPSGDPQNDYERYDLLAGGSRIAHPTAIPADYRYCLSAGPFVDLAPGEELCLQVAFAVGEGFRGLSRAVMAAQRIYDGQWRDVDGLPETGCDGRETCLHVAEPGTTLLWRDPCDPTIPLPPPVKIKNTDCDRAEYWADNDCNCCTPLQVDAATCEGWEELVRWVGVVAPPPPRVNVEEPEMRAAAAGDQWVRIEWDNASELLALPSGGNMFCGYRVWRVEGWQRPIGSFGPAPYEWQPLVELAVAPQGYQLDLHDYTNEFAAVVDTLEMGPDGTEWLLYDVGRYFYVDSAGVKNGMLYFYDVTAFDCWYDAQGRYQEVGGQPAATEAYGVTPRWATVTDDWRAALMVVPNPWKGGAEWDLVPSDADPTGSHIDFANLPNRDCEVRIYTLAGDLVQTLHHDPGPYRRGTVRWNMLSRNGQEITSGLYFYAVTCGDQTEVGRFTVIR